MADNDKSDSDVEDILGDLLANDNTSETEEPAIKTLTELDFNFLDANKSTNEFSDHEKKDQSSILHNSDDDSSDDEDKKYFEEQKYSDWGRSIKSLLKKQELDREESSIAKELSKLKSPVAKNNSCDWNSIEKKVANNTFAKSPERTVKKSNNRDDKVKTGPLHKWLSKPSDIYTDPIFGLRIVTPLVSSAELKERMRDRTAVTVSKIKHFISTETLENDWAIAGVLIQRSATRKSQSGNAYCIWTISDLSENLNRVTLFLFKNAYKLFWKTTEGTVVGVLNPNILESRNDKDQATLSVDMAQKIMILGTSKDMGKCKSTKKSGELCGNIVNISRCEYCIYHVKQEYNKASRRPDLQTDVNNRRFGNNFGAKPKNSAPGIYSQGNNNHNMLAIPAKRNLKMEKKDSERLAMLMGKIPPSQKSSDDKTTDAFKNKSCMVELTNEQAKKDVDRLNKIRGWSPKSLLDSAPKSNTLALFTPLKPTSIINANEKTPTNSLVGLSVPQLGFGIKGGSIDFSEPVSKKRINAAKINAINWVRENGSIKQSNPNKIGESREKIEGALKRRHEDDQQKVLPQSKKMNTMSDTFKELMETSSAHSDLVEKSHEIEKEKYFNKLETKERMEEKMLNTFKVECKAVKCLICQYTAFSASEMCKENKHPLRVINAVKSFFKCSDCGNRTVSLDRIPSYSCKKCSSSNWMRAAMMDDKKMSIPGAVLSIRGGEEKFIGSDIKDINLNLLVPESDNN